MAQRAKREGQATRARTALRNHPEEPIMLLTAKEVPCPCGHVTTLTTRKLMCIKCGKYVFYNEQEKKAHRRQTLFVATVLVLALGFAAYFFVEMILGPLSLLME